jgi:microcystin degradation protein MlrC
LAGLYHETHTFLDGHTRLAECTTRRGAQMLAAEGDASPLGGVLEAAREFDWKVLPAIDVRATPSATMDDEVVELWWRECEAALHAALFDGLDGVYLVLHGAMVSTSLRDVEGEMLRRLREVVGGSTPIAGVTDLHANFTQAMAQYSNALVTYRQNPHTDAKESARRVAALLNQLMNSNRRASTYWLHPPIVWPPTGTATADEPMRTLEKMAREIEAGDADILAANVHAGYSFADTPDTGVSFSIVTQGDEQTARAYLNQLGNTAMGMKAEGNPTDPPLESIMPQVREWVATGQTPVILVEPSDNIGAGAPGDDTAVLRALLVNKIESSAVVINDPAAVQSVSCLRVGESTRVSLGGKDSRLGAGPLELKVELISTSSGRFELEDKQSHLAARTGSFVEMGPCALVCCEGVRILLTTQKTPPFDLGQLRSQGIEPECCSVIGVKAAVAHRRAYDKIAAHSITVSTPGPCAGDLKLLPFQYICRPIYPLDEI